MIKFFFNDLFLIGFMVLLGIECDVLDFVIEGELLKDFVGIYYWNGFDFFYFLWEGDMYYWFDGDGMI